MQSQEHNLYFNLIHFDWEKKPQSLYFSLQEDSREKRIYKSAFPEELNKVFSDEQLENIDFVYTSFGFAKEGYSKVDIDISKTNPDFAKHYYKNKLKYYFRKKKKQIVKIGFIDNLEVYSFSKTLSTADFWVYKCFSLQVKIQKGSQFPSLLISSEGKTKILTKPVPEVLKTVPPRFIKKVLYDNNIVKYEDLLEWDEDIDLMQAYPVLNFDLIKSLNIPFDRPTKENKYLRYYQDINTFYNYFLNKPEFKKLIPIHKEGFIKVPNAYIGSIKESSRDLAYQYGKTGTAKTPKKDFPRLKPAEKSPYKNVHIFFVYPSFEKETKDLLKSFLQDGKGNFYKGLYDYATIPNFIDDDASIEIKDIENPIPELQAKFDSYNYDTKSTKYLAIYLTPFTKEETQRQEERVYVKVKEFLLKREIVCQSVEPSNVRSEVSDFVWSLTTMSVAILAKLEGVPWRLATQPKDELIVGIGAFTHSENGVKYLSSAFSFDNSGKFNSFDYFIKDNIDLLAGNISKKVREFATANGLPQRLIIHFYKRLSEDELIPIERELNNLELPQPIPVFIISINKTEATDIVAFDYNWQGLMPISGTYINIGNKQYLLFNNSRTAEGHLIHDGFHFPVKLAIDCNKKELLNDTNTIHDLINQVYQFSRMYYKSLNQQNLPVTIKYPEMVAEIAPFFSDDEIPSFGKDKLWFL